MVGEEVVDVIFLEGLLVYEFLSSGLDVPLHFEDELVRYPSLETRL